ncbi:BofC C-terminal domain-containing protein [Paenibacillus nanensis]|nr:BofC C-terminal domain-containing protein [Paenibacillus nanensis]
MMTFSLWKQLKRRLRRSRKPLWTLGAVAFWITASIGCGAAITAVPPVLYAKDQPSISEALANRTDAIPVILRRIYVCGEETESLGRLEGKGIVRLLMEHPEWSASLDRDGESVTVVEHIEDLSDYCKSHAYFGIDKNGNFSLFDGAPKEEKVLRTFFQLDIRFMESSLPDHQLEQLNQGIRVSDIDEYNSVLSTYSDYAMEPNEKAMKQAY